MSDLESLQSRLAVLEAWLPDLSPEQLIELESVRESIQKLLKLTLNITPEIAEAIRKFENPTPEEMEENRRDEAKFRRIYLQNLGVSRDFDDSVSTKQPFECPDCGHTEYKAILRGNGILGPGGMIIITGYECLGCSVKFDDISKFSKKKK